MKPFRVGGTGIRTYDKRTARGNADAVRGRNLKYAGHCGPLAGVEYILEKGTDAIWRQADAYARAFL